MVMNRPVDDLAWRNPDLLGRSLHVPAMLSNDERTIIAYAAQQLRRRHPVIVELGCYIGASTMALVDGLLARPKAKPPKRAVIHSYDRFIADQFMVDHSLQEHGVEAGGNFEHVLATMLGDARGLVEVHAGDIRTERWTGKPVDLLFVDILWGWDINQHVIDQFYAHLRPDAVLLHQDFIYSFYPWLTCSMEWLVQRGAFAYEHYAPPSTVSFRVATATDRARADVLVRRRSVPRGAGRSDHHGCRSVRRLSARPDPVVADPALHRRGTPRRGASHL
jgi:hypothetical protein